MRYNNTLTLLLMNLKPHNLYFTQGTKAPNPSHNCNTSTAPGSVTGRLIENILKPDKPFTNLYPYPFLSNLTHTFSRTGLNITLSSKKWHSDLNSSASRKPSNPFQGRLAISFTQIDFRKIILQYLFN